MLDRPTLFMAGTAGAGKSTLTGAFADWMGTAGLQGAIINLDPGAEDLPYEPTVDIRDVVRLDELMVRERLGPNGAQIAAADLIALNLDDVIASATEAKPDLFIVDTPGQLELFAFRASGQFVTGALSSMPAMAFLIDPVVSQDPRGLMAQQMLAATVHFRLQIPTINVVSKFDILPEAARRNVELWVSDADAQQDALDERATDNATQFTGQVHRLLQELGASVQTFVASAETYEGIEDLHATITGLFAGGEPELPG